MKHFLLVILCIFSFHQITCQDKVTDTPIKLSNSAKSYDFVDKDGNIHFFFIDRPNMHHLKYDSDLNLLFQRKYGADIEGRLGFITSQFDIYGFTIDDDENINLYLTNLKKAKFLNFKINKKGNFISKLFKLKFKKEDYVTQFNYDNHYYYITSSKNSSLLNIYDFHGDNFVRKVLSFEKYPFLNAKDKRVTLNDVLIPDHDKEVITIIKNDLPNSIETASNKFKIYQNKNNIELTLDHRNSVTRILKFNLNNENVSIENFDQPRFKMGNPIYLKSNSFIQDNRLYQIIISEKNIVVTITDRESKKQLKQFEASLKDNLEFASSPIIVEGGRFEDYRELSKTKQFLNKVATSSPGITAYQNDNQLQLNIGVAKTIAGGLPMIGIPGMSVGNIGSVNFTVTAYSAYTSTRSTYVNSILNPENFKKIDEELKTNIFDLVSDHMEELKLKFKTIVELDTMFVVAGYDKKNKAYSLIKFEEQ
ncbi:hypothetical protein [Spongiivirga citrea]|uniref:Uncharacterized protein n=1 Tax=Spongiivirga citrea TaxID=1481457 RepID=A0A6M0CJF0_9FLAO|nr:hypothetical protein [Spongiivirga citrea]NER17971.1 hypothetical protein [Spongiivirga citrea]